MSSFPTFSRLWNALPPRAASSVESASIVRIMAACDRAGIDASGMLSAWARSQRPAHARRIEAMAVELAEATPLGHVLARSRSTLRHDHAVALDFGERSGLLPAVAAATVDGNVYIPWRYRVAVGYVAVVAAMFLAVAAFFSISVFPRYVKILDDFGMERSTMLWMAESLSEALTLTAPLALLVASIGIAVVVSPTFRRWLAWPWQASERALAAVDLLGVAVEADRPLAQAAAMLAECQRDSRLAARLSRVAADGGSGRALASAGLLRWGEGEQFDALTASVDRGWLLRTIAARRRERIRRRLTVAAELLVPAGVAVMGVLVLIEALAVLGPLQKIVKGLA